MKISEIVDVRLYSMAVASSVLVSCAQVSKVKVVDAHDKLPVSSASVIAVRGNLSTAPVLTDAKGEVNEPTLPTGAKELVIARSGYDTTRIPLTR